MLEDGRNVDDAALVKRCLTGDAEALAVFVDRFERLVFGLCYRLLGDRHEAEDVTQETFYRAFRHLKHWDGRRPLRPWLLKIAVNRCRTASSRRSRHPVATEDCAQWSAAERCTAELAEELQRGLQLLRPEYRQTFVLFYQQELSVAEIAELLGCPQGTVKTWLYRARRELAEHLRQRQVVNEDGYEVQHF